MLSNNNRSSVRGGVLGRSTFKRAPAIVKGRVLVIAGSDSSAGAGIQADIKTVAALGGYATTAITAITAQNSLGVKAIFPLPLPIIQQQINAILEDEGADAIKTGMLYSQEIIEGISRCLDTYTPIPLVVDPVMVTTSGQGLLDEGAIASLKQLFRHAALITPNIPEAEKLLSCTITSLEEMVQAGKALLTFGCTAVLIKGGHLPAVDGLIYDVWVTGQGHRIFEHRYKSFPNGTLRGTGCTLASAIACYIAQGGAMEEAIGRARQYLQGCMKKPWYLGKGYGSLNHTKACNTISRSKLK